MYCTPSCISAIEFLKIFKFLSYLSGHVVGKWFDKKTKFDFNYS